jgi:GT2 family glycosyltransferase
MALIAMAVWDTVENGRTELTIRTLEHLQLQIGGHRLVVVDNGSCEETGDYLRDLSRSGVQVITLPENIGTARAINKAWALRRADEPVVKMDNDVLIYSPDWLDRLCEVVRRDATIGIVGLKRKDLAESPLSEVAYYRSTLRMLPHQPGERWLVVEEVLHVMGTCQLYSARLLSQIGFLAQPGVYGFDDALASLRAHISGFKTVFLHGVEIDHIDPGGTDYTAWKAGYAAKMMAAYNKLAQEFKSGTRAVYCNEQGE